MSLRRQLLVVSLLLLTLPWAGCQFVREMEGALREGQAQALQATASAVAASLAEYPQHIYPFENRRHAIPDNRASVYAFHTNQRVIIDGYGDGWESIPRSTLRTQGGFAVSYAAQLREDQLYLLFEVEDDDPVYDNPGISPEPNGDRLVLRLWHNDRRQEYVIASAAPGSVRARPGNRRERTLDLSRIEGHWQDSRAGYTIELELPLAYTGGRLGFFFVDESHRAGAQPSTLGNSSALDTTAPPWLIFTPPQINALLRPFAASHSVIQVVDNERWLLTEQKSVAGDTDKRIETFWLLRLFYRSILATEELDTSPTSQLAGKIAGPEIEMALSGKRAMKRYRDSDASSRTTLVAAAPITDSDGVLGALVMRQSAETYLSLTDRAFGRLLGYSTLAVGLGVMGLLGYATVLSWRIGNLSKAASRAINDEGHIGKGFERSKMPDEIGELSRHYADLLDRVRNYNDYLRTLSRKLAHELRTPIAVIQSSLENLEQAESPDTQANYRRRAREGLARLQHMLTAMSEANRLEESIAANRLETIDLVPLLHEVHAAYQDVYSGLRIVLSVSTQEAMALGAPDLIVQALDKLVDNAVSFCPEDGEISLHLDSSGEHWSLSVRNDGSVLPDTLQNSLFQPLVSVREESSNAVHLGLGLHIVQLVAQFHQGEVDARNLPDSSGVIITLTVQKVQAENHH